jgi:hypothetical protein
VLSVDPGHSLVLKDVLTAWKVTVQERSGCEYLQPTAMVFGRAVMVDGLGILIGLGTIIIPPGFKPQLIDLRSRLREGRKPVADEHLYDWMRSRIWMPCWRVPLTEMRMSPRWPSRMH